MPLGTQRLLCDRVRRNGENHKLTPLEPSTPSAGSTELTRTARAPPPTSSTESAGLWVDLVQKNPSAEVAYPICTRVVLWQKAKNASEVSLGTQLPVLRLQVDPDGQPPGV